MPTGQHIKCLRHHASIINVKYITKSLTFETGLVIDWSEINYLGTADVILLFLWSKIINDFTFNGIKTN